ncbi:MAG: hypothetical protein EBT63_05880 [Proteobacteria bacterium]|nr:hypothetical protein [Pseudomonadota bacterium]NCA28245.1 hypothetical protein [Pseudomonadota bacterium]
MNFYQLCEECLQDLSDKIENLDINSNLELEYLDGILKIIINKNKKTFIVNRNSGNQKIWYSSPFSGADYFSYNELQNKWLNSKNVELFDKLFLELNSYLS